MFFIQKQTLCLPTPHLNFQYLVKSSKTNGLHPYLCKIPFGQIFASFVGNFFKLNCLHTDFFEKKKKVIHNVIPLLSSLLLLLRHRDVQDSKQTEEMPAKLSSKYHSYLQPGPVHILRQFHTNSVCYNKCFIRINLSKRQEHMNSS